MRAMQGTTSVRIALAHALLFFTHALADTESYTTLTSTTTIATSTTTITITVSRNKLATSTSTSYATSVTEEILALSSPSTSTSAEVPTQTAMVASLEDVVLNSTNVYREQYKAKPLIWNTTLADFAEDYAKNCIWEHSGGPYGENLAANFENSTLAVDAWGNEEPSYNYRSKEFTEANGHFTQLVWQNTTSVGCGLVQCDNDAENGVKGAYLVCEYSPRGNVKGEFGYNVQKPGMAEDGTLGLGSAAPGSKDGARKSVLALVAFYLLSALL